MTSIERAIYLLRVVNRFISTSSVAEAHTIFYDDTDCDGICLALDCTFAANELEIEQKERNGTKK